MLGISEKSVGGWKCKDRWEDKLNGVLQTEEQSTPKEKGGQLGNRNAAGNSGGAAPPGNLNAIKHGAYQTIYAAYLQNEEKAVYEQMPGEADLESEIRLLRLKIARLLNRQADFFYDMFGNRHDKQISEEDREAGILACMKQLEKLVRTQERNQMQREQLELERKKVKLIEQRQNGGEWEEDLSELDREIYGD